METSMPGLIISAVLAISANYTNCIAHIDQAAFVKSQTLACVTADMDRADAALNRQYRITIARLAPRQRSHLVLEERAWIARRRRHCLAAEQSSVTSPEIDRMLCLVRESDERTALLQSLS